MIGLLSDKSNVMTLNFKNEGDLIYLLGDCYDDISSSEYLANYLNIDESPAPFFSMDKEIELQSVLSDLIENQKILSAHDISDGGLYVCLVESCMVNDLGFDILTNHDFRQDAYLFGESQSRAVVTISADQKTKFEKHLKGKITCTFLGQVTESKILIDDVDFGNVSVVKDGYMSSLEKKLEV